MSCSSTLLILLLSFSTNLYAADSSSLEFNGLQMAWVKLPKETSTEEQAPVNKTQKNIPNLPATKPIPRPPMPPSPPVVIKPAVQPMPAEVAAPIKPAAQPTPPAVIAPIKPAAAPLPAIAPSKPINLVPARSSVANPAERVSQPPPGPAHTSRAPQWMIELGFEVGGDELGKVYFADGSSKSVNANQGYVLNMGTLIQNGKSRTFSTQLSVGYKLGGVWGDNGSVTWRSIPIEALEFYQAGNMRVGLGLGYQLNPRLEVSIPSSGYTDKYNNALGLIAQVGWSPAKGNYSIDLRYTAVKFQPSSASNTTIVKGNVVGLHTSYKF